MSDWTETLGLDKAKHRKFSRRLILPVEHEHSDSFAPYHGPGRCVDSVGYVRDDHEYLIEERDGTHCVWCWRLRRMEPI